MKPNASLDTSSSECFDQTSQNGSISFEDENSDVTIENGTENTDDYVEDTVSALSEPMDDENQSEYSPIKKSTWFKATPRIKSARSISSSGVSHTLLSGIGAGVGVGVGVGGSNSFPSSSAATDGNHLLQKAAAAAYNYKVINKDLDGEYLYAYHSEDDEKVYEDLCYVTFSNKTQEVR